MEEPSDDLAGRVQAVNRVLNSQRSLPSAVGALAQVLERTVPECDSVGVAMIVRSSPMTVATSSLLALEADLVQYGQQEGPCLTAVAEAKRVRIDLMEHDERYEHFAPGAIELGVESVLSVPIPYGDEVVGSFNLYSKTPRAFVDAVTDDIEAIAEYAGELIARSPLFAYATDLYEVLAQRVHDADVIAIAVGMLMANRTIGAVEARRQIEQRAEERHITVPDAATQVIDELLTEESP